MVVLNGDNVTLWSWRHSEEGPGPKCQSRSPVSRETDAPRCCGHSCPWNLEEGNKVISGYTCNKATTTYGGRDWTVWYAPEIPSTAGPWKFNGLPGLILAAGDSESLHEFEAIAFRKGTTPVVMAKDATVFQSTRKNALKAKLVAEKDIAAGRMPGPSEVREVSIIKTLDGSNIVYINGVARRPRPNGYQPLELE